MCDLDGITGIGDEEERQDLRFYISTLNVELKLTTLKSTVTRSND